MCMSLIISGILRIMQRSEEPVSKILFFIHFIISIFVQKPRFNAISFVLYLSIVFIFIVIFKFSLLRCAGST